MSHRKKVLIIQFEHKHSKAQGQHSPYTSASSTVLQAPRRETAHRAHQTADFPASCKASASLCKHFAGSSWSYAVVIEALFKVASLCLGGGNKNSYSHYPQPMCRWHFHNTEKNPFETKMQTQASSTGSCSANVPQQSCHLMAAHCIDLSTQPLITVQFIFHLWTMWDCRGWVFASTLHAAQPSEGQEPTGFLQIWELVWNHAFVNWRP